MLLGPIYKYGAIALGALLVISWAALGITRAAYNREVEKHKADVAKLTLQRDTAEAAAKECSDATAKAAAAGEATRQAAEQSTATLQRTVATLAAAATQRIAQAQQQAPPPNATCEEKVKWLSDQVAATLAASHWPVASPAPR